MRIKDSVKNFYSNLPWWKRIVFTLSFLLFFISFLLCIFVSIDQVNCYIHGWKSWENCREGFYIVFLALVNFPASFILILFSLNYPGIEEIGTILFRYHIDFILYPLLSTLALYIFFGSLALFWRIIERITLTLIRNRNGY